MSSMHASLAEIEAVYRSRGSDFFRLALARTGEAETAREAVQEGFARAIRGRFSYRGTGSLEAWIARCVINVTQDLVREPRPGADDQAGAEVASNGRPELGAMPPPGVEAGIVRAAVRQLPQRQRDALYLRFYLGFDYAAIAETLGIEIGTVSATLHAARARLAHNLKEEVAG
jgi:RNA polymerase sigma-70 factor (ECF subfamily)